MIGPGPSGETTPSPPEGEYLGADDAGREYFTRGGHVYTLETSRRCIRGRFAAFNRVSVRRGEAGAIAA